MSYKLYKDLSLSGRSIECKYFIFNGDEYLSKPLPMPMAFDRTDAFRNYFWYNGNQKYYERLKDKELIKEFQDYSEILPYIEMIELLED